MWIEKVLKRTDRGLFQDMSRYSAGNNVEKYEIFPSRKLISIPTLAHKWFIANKELQSHCCASLPFCSVSHHMTWVRFKSRRGTYCLTPVSMLFFNSVGESWTEDSVKTSHDRPFTHLCLFNIRVELPHFYRKFCTSRLLNNSVIFTNGPGSNPGGDEIFYPSSPALVPTQPHVKWVPGFSRG